MIKEKKNNFTNEDYLEIHNLAYEFQNGNKEAGMKIVNNFRLFKMPYLYLFTNSNYEIIKTSSSSIKFIKLFIESKENRNFINKYMFKKAKYVSHIDNKLKQIITSSIKYISDIFINLEREDIEQTLDLVILEMVSKYKDTKPSLHHYINRNFHFYLYRCLEKESRDPLARGYTSFKRDYENGDNYLLNLIIDSESTYSENDLLNNIEIHYVYKKNNIKKIDKEELSIYEDNFLNEDWINGITCSGLFKTLTVVDRYILALWYVGNHTDKEIAKKLHVCRATVNKRRAKAKGKLYIEAINRGYIKKN